jgi:hypothetical protein
VASVQQQHGPSEPQQQQPVFFSGAVCSGFATVWLAGADVGAVTSSPSLLVLQGHSAQVTRGASRLITISKRMALASDTSLGSLRFFMAPARELLWLDSESKSAMCYL